MPYITHDIGHGGSIINDGIIMEEILDENDTEQNKTIYFIQGTIQMQLQLLQEAQLIYSL